jgi:enoyl-CoA hydratase/carnithine racemase
MATHEASAATVERARVDGEIPLIRVAARDRILEVTLDNPPDNRLCTRMFERLDRVLDDFEADEFDLLLLTAAGRTFSKGFEVADVLAGREDLESLRKSLVFSNAVISRMSRSRKPTVAVINGACMGGGLELVLGCHFRLCVERARLGLPEIWLNLVPGLGGFYRLSRLAGQAKALELTAMGDLLTSEDAQRLGIVHRVFPRQELVQRTETFVRSLLLADRRVLGELLRMADLSLPPGEEENLRQGMKSFGQTVLWLYEKNALSPNPEDRKHAPTTQ